MKLTNKQHKTLSGILEGDCLEVLKTLEDNSIDAVVTDPPYGLGFMGKEWDTFDKSQFGQKGLEGENDLKVKKNFNVLPRYSSDGLYDFTLNWAKKCLRVLKPGGYLLSFAGTRTQHKVCMGIEDAGFEIRDMIAWVYGSGFPKSLNIGKVMDKYLKTGNASWNGTGDSTNGALGYSKLQHKQGYRPNDYSNKHQNKDEITEEKAKQWEGYGTALKPALEPITVARKPIEGTVAENCLKWGVGGINIDESRVDVADSEKESFAKEWDRFQSGSQEGTVGYVKQDGEYDLNQNRPLGRFPANLIHDNSEEVRECFPETGKSSGGRIGNKGSALNMMGQEYQKGDPGFGDSGSAARFFYCAKASKSERNKGCEELNDKPPHTTYAGDAWSLEHLGNTPANYREKVKNNHPTVKPIALMEYLVKLVSKEGHLVLDPFAGSGSTLIACKKLNRNFIGIEKEPEYIKIANARLKAVPQRIL